MAVQRLVRSLKITLVRILVGLLVPIPLSAHVDRKVDIEQRYSEFVDRDSSAAQPLPFQILTDESDGLIRSSVRVELTDVLFDEVSRALSSPADWCELVPLHLNVKACTYDLSGPRPNLRFYIGRKYFQDPEDAQLLSLEFSADIQPKLLTVMLEADEGPYGTSDYRFHLHAIPTDDGVFLELALSSRLGLASSVLDVYFVTLARNKIGFSKVADSDNGYQYVAGTQGANERNVVRYLLALRVYFQTLDVPKGDRFRVRAQQWYDATEEFHEQLHEVDRADYLRAKEKEWQRQQALQRLLEQGE